MLSVSWRACVYVYVCIYVCEYKAYITQSTSHLSSSQYNTIWQLQQNYSSIYMIMTHHFRCTRSHISVLEGTGSNVWKRRLKHSDPTTNGMLEEVKNHNH